MDDGTVIREVDPKQAEAVLTIRLVIPGVAEGVEDRHHLARVRPRRSDYLIDSVTVNPDGSITEVGTVSSSEEVVVAHACHTDGRTADGRGFGFGKTVSIEGHTADSVAVRVSMYWTARDGRRGSLDEELVLPWLGATRKELGGRAWVAAEITPAGGEAEPLSWPTDCSENSPP